MQLYIAKVPIGSWSGYGSGENFPDPDPTKKVRIRNPGPASFPASGSYHTIFLIETNMYGRYMQTQEEPVLYADAKKWLGKFLNKVVKIKIPSSSLGGRYGSYFFWPICELFRVPFYIDRDQYRSELRYTRYITVLQTSRICTVCHRLIRIRINVNAIRSDNTVSNLSIA